MGKLQNHWLLFCNRLLLGLLALLGFTGCDDEHAMEEYGTPTAKYCVKGKVVDADTKKPLTGIRVVSGSLYHSMNNSTLHRLWADTVYTNGRGEFESEYLEFPGEVYRVIWEDIREIPEYKKDSTDISLKGKYSGASGNWYEGQVNLDVQIEAKKNNP